VAFHETTLTGADLRHAQLQGANLSGVDLRGADFTNANVKEADFRKAKLDGIILAEANSIGLRVDHALPQLVASASKSSPALIQVSNPNPNG